MAIPSIYNQPQNVPPPGAGAPQMAAWLKNAPPMPGVGPVLDSLMQSGNATPDSVRQQLQARQDAAMGNITGPTGQAPAPTPAMAANAPPVPKSPQSQSPVHDFVRQNPGVDAKAVGGKFNLSEPTAQSVIDDVRQGRAPLNLNVPPIQPTSRFNEAINALSGNMASNFPPVSYGNVPPSATLSTPATAAAAPTNTPPMPQGAPTPAVAPSNVPPATAPGEQPSPYAVKTPNAPPMPQSPVAGITPQGLGMPTTIAQAGAIPSPQASNIPMPKHGHANTLALLGRLAVPTLLAVAGRNNPGAAASFYGGYKGGQDQLQARSDQLAAIARAKTQQDFEDSIKTKTEQDTEGYHQLLAKNGADKNVIAQTKADALKSRYGDQETQSFYNEIAKFSGNPEAQKGIASRYDKMHGGSDFTDALGQAGTGMSDNATHHQNQDEVARQRANDYGDYTKAHIDEIEATAGLKRSEGKYYDAKTGEVVPDAVAHRALWKATSEYLGQRTKEVVPEAEARIAYEDAMGNAAGENADTNRYGVMIKGAVATADIAKLAAETGVDQARIAQIAGKDPNFDSAVQLLKAAQQRKQQAMAGTMTDDAAKKAIIAAEDYNIKQYSAIVNGRLTGTQNVSMAPPAPANPGSVSVPNVPGPSGGKQTPRSLAYGSGVTIAPSLKNDTFGGSAAPAVRAGRVLGSLFGITDIGGKADPADKGKDGHQQNSDHYTGNALDFMTHNDNTKGQELADYAQANAGKLGVKYIIWQQHIWSPARASEGWRPMEDRGSPTANRYDHVHISFGGGSNAQPVPRKVASSSQNTARTRSGHTFTFQVNP